MNQFVRRMRDQNGFTLIELIASLSLLSLVMGTIYAVITFGFTSYNKVTVENALRDEADIIMSSVMTELYTLGPSTIKSIPNQEGIELIRQPLDSKITETTKSQIIINRESGSQKDILLIGGNPLDPTGQRAIHIDANLTGSTIRLECGGIQDCHSGLIVINLQLAQDDKKGISHTLNMQSRFGF
ncbi:prepilin-type N-terminal cleavage/methylation domain-containing protein [Paenibacillus sp. N3.4]|uniref:prepilin-type N-terminal cleavage/methylation domain-containing protein n=1 Tax=Paenibacillus sp. N3.4 TaxID=2603222 RepID=UPI0011CA1575|nr:prepilin-type N-terminal cleavage/methylation domain-containing protein [Paenibacillus sp. N3.4]TXK85383.1 prepilin-type N-terminal cleavage/methylation domain-containing protein [Paenibacillus sp. N3.4]